MPRGTRPTPEQKAARQQLAEARRATLERKKRTRRLIQMGGVVAAYGFEEPAEVERVVRRVLGSEENREWAAEQGLRRTERWPEGGYRE